MAKTDKIAPGKKERKNSNQSTQNYLRISEIRDNLVVLKNGGIRAILKTTSLNFNLKSEEEQNSIIFSYQGFINSLEFPVQILIRSKKLDIDDYIEQVKGLGDKQENKLLQEQTYEYAQYIKRLVEYADIMEKEFYVIVPYDPGGSNEGPNKFQSFFQRIAPKDSYGDIKTRRSQFSTLKRALDQRLTVVKGGLEGCGLKVKQLETLEIIELYYNTYNPESSQTQKLKETDKIAVETDEELIEREESTQKEAKKAFPAKGTEKKEEAEESTEKTPEANAPTTETPTAETPATATPTAEKSSEKSGIENETLQKTA
ncbi:MAG: hypothetical protein O3B47_04655 [bacterium]|nr:hypothetical protein [bacterium]